MIKFISFFILAANSHAFSPRIHQLSTKRLNTPKIHFSPTDFEPCSSIMLSETESWRQYVPLAVSCGVILDILLGSPAANLVLAPMKRASEDDSEGTDGGGDMGGLFGEKKSSFVKNPKERIDTDAVAQEAIQRARYSMELRNFLEENKTDEQRYEDVRKKIDAQTEELDQKGW